MIKFLPLTDRPWGHLIVDNWNSLYNVKLTNDKRHCNWSRGNKLKFLQVVTSEECHFVWLELLLLPLSGFMLCCSWSLCRCFWPVLLQREGHRKHACWNMRAVLNQSTPCWPWNIWPCPALDTATGEPGLALRRDGLNPYHRCGRIDQWHESRRSGSASLSRVAPVSWSEDLGYNQTYHLHHLWLSETCDEEVLWNYKYRISMTWGNNHIYKRSFGEGAEMLVCHRP